MKPVRSRFKYLIFIKQHCHLLQKFPNTNYLYIDKFLEKKLIYAIYSKYMWIKEYLILLYLFYIYAKEIYLNF